METLQTKGTFVLLKHTRQNEVHFDLILEGHEHCPTFQFSTIDSPIGTRIQDHRMKYLTFEGKISPEKGTVIIVQKGTFIYDDSTLTLQIKPIHRQYKLQNQNQLHRL